jgi:hypothetical protein
MTVAIDVEWRATVTPEQAKLKQRGERLYDRYAKPLEAEHAGKFIAISPSGQLIIGDTMREVAERATAKFGRGNFLFKIGPRSVGRWR